jgi:hypothetical protein
MFAALLHPARQASLSAEKCTYIPLYHPPLANRRSAHILYLVTCSSASISASLVDSSLPMLLPSRLCSPFSCCLCTASFACVSRNRSCSCSFCTTCSLFASCGAAKREEKTAARAAAAAAQHVSHLLLAQLSVFLLQLLLQAPYGRGNLRARLWRIFRYRHLMQGRNKTTAGGGGEVRRATGR